MRRRKLGKELRRAREGAGMSLKDVGWWAAFSDTIPHWFATYVDLESDADQIWTSTSELIDCLLQTPDYTEAVTRAAYPDITDEELRRSVELRTARQAQLNGENPAELHVC